MKSRSKRKQRAGTPTYLRDETYARLQRVAEHIACHGWTSVRAARQEKPTLTAVLDEAVLQLEATHG